MNSLDDRGIDEVVCQIEILYDHLMRTKGTGRHFLKLRELEVQLHFSIDSVIQKGKEITDVELIEKDDNFREPGTYYGDI